MCPAGRAKRCFSVQTARTRTFPAECDRVASSHRTSPPSRLSGLPVDECGHLDHIHADDSHPVRTGGRVPIPSNAISTTLVLPPEARSFELAGRLRFACCQGWSPGAGELSCATGRAEGSSRSLGAGEAAQAPDSLTGFSSAVLLWAWHSPTPQRAAANEDDPRKQAKGAMGPRVARRARGEQLRERFGKACSEQRRGRIGRHPPARGNRGEASIARRRHR